jgi:hypothetical protein
MKKLSIAHFIVTLVLMIFLIFLERDYSRQKRVLFIMADALVTMQEAEMNRMQPCSEETKDVDVRTLARR